MDSNQIAEVWVRCARCGNGVAVSEEEFNSPRKKFFCDDCASYDEDAYWETKFQERRDIE